MSPKVKSFFDPVTNTVSHVVADMGTKQCAIIDPVLGFDPKSGRTNTTAVDPVLAQIRKDDLSVQWIIETHAHADHLSAAQIVKDKVGGLICIGDQISKVQATWKDILNLSMDFATDGSQFDHLFSGGDTFHIGGLEACVLFTPGHTPADSTFIIGDAAFVGDTIFMPDYGTARVDFPGGDAEKLYESIHQIFDLPGTTRLFMCHDYLPEGRSEFKWETTVAEEKKSNIHVHDGINKSDFVAMRKERDQTLDVPILLLPSIQVNINAGQMPRPEGNGLAYLKIPVNGL